MSDLRPFTHRIYVDFSGDDGDPRTPGASRCICIAWVLSSERDLSHNKNVVLEIKKIISCQKNDELKYRSLTRHKRKDGALKLLSKLKVNIVVVPVFKERITEEELKNPRTKRLVNLIHYFPLNRLIDYLLGIEPNIYFQLVFDEVGWTGCKEEIVKSFRQNSRLDWKRSRPDWLLFAKSRSNLMLQLADVVAGLAREYVEGLQSQRMPPCIVCWVKGTHDCSYKRNNRRVGKASLMKILYPLLIRDGAGNAWERGFVVRPPGVERDYLFIDCLFGEVQK